MHPSKITRLAALLLGSICGVGLGTATAQNEAPEPEPFYDRFIIDGAFEGLEPFEEFADLEVHLPEIDGALMAPSDPAYAVSTAGDWRDLSHIRQRHPVLIAGVALLFVTLLLATRERR